MRDDPPILIGARPARGAFGQARIRLSADVPESFVPLTSSAEADVVFIAPNLEIQSPLPGATLPERAASAASCAEALIRLTERRHPSR
jgi:hypothetical protein